MKKFIKFLITSLVLVAVIVSCTVMFASANEAKVIYISQNGTGDGSSPEQAMGYNMVTDSVTYKNPSNSSRTKNFSNASYESVITWLKGNDMDKTKTVKFLNDAFTKAHPLYKAIKELGSEGGKIVVVGELALDAAVTFEIGYEGKMVTPAAGPIVIEGYNSSAKLVLDHTVYNSTHIQFSGDTTIQNIAIENRYNSNIHILNNANYSRSTMTHHFSFFAGGNNLTMGTGITTTSFNYASGSRAAGNEYPSIYASSMKTAAITGNPVITVKSGHWTDVSAGGHCIYKGEPDDNADLNGNVIVNVEGGIVEKLWGGGKTTTYQGSSLQYMHWSTVRGNSTLNISGGTVNSVYGVTSAGITGTLTINTSEAATIGEIVYKNTTNTSTTVNNGENTKPGIAYPTSAVVNCYVIKGQSSHKDKVSGNFTSVNVKNVYGKVVNVDGTLNVNVELNIDFEVTQATKDAIAAGKAVKYLVVIGDRVQTEYEITADMIGANDIVTFTASLHATEMTADVSGTLFVGEVECDTYTTTFEAYAQQVATDNPEDFAGVVAAVLKYGEMSQIYVGDLDTPTVPQGDRKEQLSTYETGFSVEGESSQYTYNYSALVLFDKVAIRHYFSIVEGADTSVFDGLNDKGYYVEISVLPQAYADVQVRTVGELTVRYSVLNYAYLVSQQTSDKYTTTKNVVYALYDYFEAVNTPIA